MITKNQVFLIQVLVAFCRLLYLISLSLIKETKLERADF